MMLMQYISVAVADVVVKKRGVFKNAHFEARLVRIPNTAHSVRLYAKDSCIAHFSQD